jgi:uncharacterized protein YrrD
VTEERPIAWSALEKGTRVFAAGGDEVGRVSDVFADEEKDIFSGVLIKSGLFDADHFVSAHQIQDLTTAGVYLKLTREEIESLDPYEG